MSTLKRVTKNELARSSSTLETTRLFIAQQNESMLYYIDERCGKGISQYKSRKTINCHNTPLAGSSLPLLGLSMLSHCTENKTLA